MSSHVHQDDTALESIEQLVAYMKAGCKSTDRWVIGTEHEKIGWWPDRGRPPTYEDPEGIGTLLSELVNRFGWAAQMEDDAIIALLRDRESITLEPGGQLELSGAPLRSLFDTELELDRHLREVNEVSEDLGIEWSGLGINPWGAALDMPLMPKARYGILQEHVEANGPLGLRMMRQTATVQANLDYGSEEDAFRKFRLGLWLQPLVIAAFANSTVVEGKLVKERSFRARIWEDTAPDRCDLSPVFLDGQPQFEDYVQWSIDVPMLFIHRDDKYLNCRGRSFREFMTEGWNGHRANLGDFVLHLSTLFPDVRLKQHLEVRAADMGDRNSILTLSALHVGLLYDETALERGLALFEGLGHAEWSALRRQVTTTGLATPFRGGALGDLGNTLVELAIDGLSRWEPGTERFLTELHRQLGTGLCPADTTRATYDGDPAKLLADTRIC